MNNYTQKSSNTDYKRPQHRREMGISWRLFGALVVFIAFVLLVIWIFQVLMLNWFYEQSKLDEFDTTNNAIIEAAGDPERLSEVASFYAAEYDECMMVFKVAADGKYTILQNICTAPSCIIHHVSENVIESHYENAAANQDGVYIERLRYPKSPDNPDSRRELGTIYTSVKRLPGNELMVIMLNSEHIPLSATVNTLEMQFGWIAFVLLIGAFIVAIIISRSVCRPLKEMSASAERLAKGDYSASFKGGGYRETQELADALNYAAEELSKTDKLQRELVANISHDLRTPLTMIKGYGEVMRDIPEENTPENIQVVIDETERLTELVNDMLDVSKIRSGARKPSYEEFNLTQTVKEVMQRYSKLTERDGYDITFDFDREVYVYADRTMILQVVYNLINNAINYTGEDRRVRVLQVCGDNTVRISVTDTGEGISKDDMPKVWDRYYKVDKVHKRARVGTGLGLSIVKGVLEKHEAAYGLNSKVGEGSTFWFELETVEGKNIVY